MGEDNLDLEKRVSNEYLHYREQVLEYTYEDMNLTLDNDQQVYLAIFDIPLISNIVGFQTQTLALVFGLNTHIYHGSGNVILDLEKNPEVMKAMQSLLISSHQVLEKMTLTENVEFYNSENVRVYLKTKSGIYFKELKDNSNKENNFLIMLMNYVLVEITKQKKRNIDSNKKGE